MTSIDLCPSAQRCPVFSGILRGKEFSTQSYQDCYCKKGEIGWLDCKRWQVRQKYVVCPPNVLPNSLKSIDELVGEYKLTAC